jgi:histidinol-phosphatase (PHP family)
MYWTNYHSHCLYCDGTSELESYLHEAVSQKVKSYGFSSHAPLPFPTLWAMRYGKVAQYLEEATHLKTKFRDLIQVYVGMEVDYIPDMTGPKSDFIQSLRLDYVIGSVHFVYGFPDGTRWEIDNTSKIFKEGLKHIYKNNIRKAIKDYYHLLREMIEVQTPDVVGHLDKIKIHNANNDFFDESEKWYQKNVIKTLESMAKTGCVLEVNTRGEYKKKVNTTYPSRWILELALEMQIPITISSDAHHPKEITGNFQNTAELLRKIGFRQLKILWNGTWQFCDFTEKGMDL